MADDAASYSSSPNKKRKSTSSSATPSPAPSAPEATTPSPAAGVSSSALAPWSFLAHPSPQPRSCAVCRHQCRGCGPGCPFALHFPGDEPEAFKKVRRLFGVKRVRDLMKVVEPEHHDRLVRTIKWEAEARAAHPVHGARAVIRDLEAELRDLFIELAAVNIQIQQEGAGAQPPAQRQPNMAVVMPPATQQHCDNRSAAHQPFLFPHDYPHQTSEVIGGQSTAMPNAGGQDDYYNHPAATNGFVDPTAHLTPARRVAVAHQLAEGASREQNVMMQQTAQNANHRHGHQTTLQLAAAPEGARDQNAEVVFPHGHGTTLHQMAPGSNSGAGLPAAPQAFVFQQQPPPPSPGPSWTPPWDHQNQPSPPPSP